MKNRHGAWMALLCVIQILTLTSCQQIGVLLSGGQLNPTPPPTTAMAPPPAAATPGITPGKATSFVPTPTSPPFPRLDSSTARKDMACALYRDFVLGGVMSGKEPLCSTTHYAILNLIDGKADAVFVLLPTEEELSHMAEKEVSLKARCYARDALLILGNAENPVESLASEQLKAIYRGEITNWKELGGPDAPINVYVRDSQSGSQRMFESLVWESEENMPDFSSPAYSDMEIDDMGLITNVIEADAYGIGYNFMTYIDGEFSDSQKIKSFTIDGVAPSQENIANGTYSYITTAWLLIRDGEPKDSPAEWIFAWFTDENAEKYITAYTSSVPAHGEPISLKAGE